MNLTMLVNANHPLPLDWVPDDLVDLWEQQPRHFLLPNRREYLVRPAFGAANAMFAAAKRAGFDDFEVRSAYRNAERQKAIYESSDKDGLVARPGESEHQTGLAFDVGSWHRPFVSEENAAHRDWIAAHCWEYGFIVRYPKGREETTGIPYEPWHLRFVGYDVAQEIHEHDWVLEEWHAFRGEREQIEPLPGARCNG